MKPSGRHQPWFASAHGGLWSRCVKSGERLATSAALLVALCGGGLVRAGDGGPSEYQVKAAYIFNFAKFVEWPAEKVPRTNASLVIGVYGDSPFGALLEDTVKGKTINGRKLVVQTIAKPEDAAQCHILFVSRSEKDRLRPLLDSGKARPVLTVGDTEGFADQGGMVNFILVNDTVKLEINPGAAEKAGLKISSKLLSLARIIKTDHAR